MNYGKKGTSAKQKALNSTSTKMGNKIGVLFFKAIVACVLAVAVIGICLGVGVLRGIIDGAPDISSINVSPESYKSFMYDSEGTQIATLVASSSNRIYVKIDDVPDDLKNAFVAIEDERFYEHHGIDPKGIVRAAVKGIASGFHFSQGGSTITQQLLKNNVFTGWTAEKGLIDKVQRKIQEQYLALELEKIMSKDAILENYLNTINLGQNTLGVQAASYRYFNKPVNELNLSECAVIAGITKSPTSYNPITHPEKNQERRLAVLSNMLDQGYITQEQHDEAAADPVYDRIEQVNHEVISNESFNSYFVDAAIEQVMKDLEEKLGYTHNQAYNLLYSGGLSVYTTQDPSIQAIADEEYSNPDNYPAGTEVCLEFALTVQKANGDIENHSTEKLVSYFKKLGEKGARGNSADCPFSSLFANSEKATEYVERYKAEVLEETDEILGERVEITPQPQTSMVLMEQSTGYVKAIIGGRGDKTANLTLNRATNTTRTPGSTFKVVGTYAAAVDTGAFTIADAFDDAPYQYASGQPVFNFNQDRYHGMVSMREAIVHSYNIPAVKCLTAITPAVGFDYAKNHFHVDSLIENEARFVWENGQKVSKVFSDVTQSMALGGITDGVTNLELTAAYAAIANQGYYLPPVFYSKVVDHDGNVILDNTQNEPEQAIKETTAWLLTDVMKGVLTRGTSTIANFSGMSLAGKSGTSNDFRDVWFVGYSPYYTCGVWSGNDSAEPLTSNARNFHKLFWKKVMSRVHSTIENKDFPKPDGIVTASVCRKSGKLATELCAADPRGSQITTEYFTEDTKPTERCSTHVTVSICMESGALCTQYCPEELRSVSAFIRRPQPAEGVTDDTPFTAPEGATPTTLCPIHNNPEAPGVSIDGL